MKFLSRTSPMPVFHELEFELAPSPVIEVELDVEVAQKLAEQIAQNDGGRYNHSHASSFQRVRVGINGLSEPLGSEDERGYSKNLLLPASVLRDPNPTFARQFQNALDEREHSNRASIPVAIGMFAIVSAIPAGAVAAFMSENGLTSDEILLSAGTGVAFNVLGLGGYNAFRNIYRRIVTDQCNDRIHKAHIERAAKLASKLELPPVISVK